MKKLVKKYKVVAKDGRMLFPLTTDGIVDDVYPGKGTISFESDSFDEAQRFVKDNGLVYEEPKEESHSNVE